MGHLKEFAMLWAARGSVCIGTKVVLWKLMASPVTRAKSSRIFWRREAASVEA